MSGFDYECEGQMNLEDWLKIKEEQKLPLRSPCDRHCEYEFGSLKCFENRGYYYDYKNRCWMRNAKGEIIKQLNPECDYIPKNHIEVDCNGCLFDEKGCCSYNTKNEFCTLGDKRLSAEDGWFKIIYYSNNTVGGTFPWNEDWLPVEVLCYDRAKDEYSFLDIKAKDKTFLAYTKEQRWDQIICWRYKKGECD